MSDTVLYEVGPDRPGYAVECRSNEWDDWDLIAWYPPEVEGQRPKTGRAKMVSAYNLAVERADGLVREGFHARVRVID